MIPYTLLLFMYGHIESNNAFWIGGKQLTLIGVMEGERGSEIAKQNVYISTTQMRTYVGSMHVCRW